MKYCPCCKIKKEYNQFNKNKARKDGVDVYCIECKKEKQKYKQEQKIQQRLKNQYISGEIWKDIIEFNGYECSTEGRIRNKSTSKLWSICLEKMYGCWQRIWNNTIWDRSYAFIKGRERFYYSRSRNRRDCYSC